MNHANMGDYGYAISQFRLHNTATPDIDAHPYAVTMKYGFGLNMEQELTDQFRAFMRAGWNEGEHETWGFTEADQTLAFGADLRGDWWGRQSDKLGAALVFNGISNRHQQYLAMGGMGMMLGDGNLSYGHEKIFETYYNFPIPRMRGVFGAFDVQYIDDPGYNRDRGPVLVSGMRLHIEL